MANIRTRFLPGENGRFALHRTNDVEPVLDRIKAKRDQRAWDTADGSLRHVGTVDIVLLEALCIEQGKVLADFYRDQGFQDRMLILYFQRYPKFRVAPGRNL